LRSRSSRYQHFHTESPRYLGDAAADVAVADDAKLFPGKLRRREIETGVNRTLFPMAAADNVDVAAAAGCEFEDERDRELRDRLRCVAGHVCDRDSALARRDEVDVVRSRSRLGDELQGARLGRV